MARLIYNHDVVSVEYPDAGGIMTYPIGRLKQDTLHLDSPPKDKHSNAYGIDVICLTKEAKWKYIVLTLGRESYTTSLSFWKNHGKYIELRPGRDEVFLPLGLFGIDKVQKYDDYVKVRDLADKDLFDVAATSASWADIEEWQVAYAIKEEYLASLKYKVIL